VLRLARAVHFAHQHGVLHRDLKPGNVLLQKDEGGRMKDEKESGSDSSFILHPSSFLPKITDFGLAKRLGGESGPGHQTRTGDVLGTPSYMAPEQAGGMARQIGPAADVYALGAILYELLTGRPPFLAENPVETVLQVLREEPVPPRRLQPKVPRDLETIALHCLEKTPRKRYPSAEALAEDLERFVQGRPIHARPVGLAERLIKWARRHPARAALVGVSLAALLAGAVGIFKLQQSHARLRAANTELRDTNERLTVALDHEEQQRRRNLMQLRVVQQTLGAYARSIDDQLAPLPHTEQVRRELLETRLRLFAPFLALEPSDPELLCMKGQAALDVGITQQQLGRLTEAETAYRQASDLFDQLIAEFPANPDYQHARAQADIQWAVLLQARSQNEAAEQRLRQAVARLEKLVADAPDVAFQQTLAVGYHDLALLLKRRRRPREARQTCEAAVALREKLVRTPGADDQDRWQLAGSYNNLGALDLAAGQPAKAREAFARVQRLLREIGPRFGARADYRRLLAGTYLNLAIVEQGTDLPRALDEYAEALRLWEGLRADFPTVPEYREKTADVHYSVGLLYWMSDQALQAEANLRQALRLQDDLARDFPEVAAYPSGQGATLYYLGRVLAAGGRPR
jgi:tetratricopeptide (TPR) repeat protein